MTGRDDLFDLAMARADLEKIAGVPLFRAGRRVRGECPLCGASKGKKAGGAFSADPRAKVWKCWGCDEGGDAIDLEHRLRSVSGETLRDAALRIVGAPPAPDGPAAPPARRPERPVIGQPDDDAWKARLAVTLWREARPAARSPVGAYLSARGISGRPLNEGLKHLRFHPAAYHSGPAHRPVLLPAMVALVRTPEGPTGGVHVTYLAPDGLAKTHRTPSKIMWGPQGHDGRPGGVWLTHPTAEGPLVVAEGIESALAAAVLMGRPCRAAAALSLGRLQGGWLADAWGRRDPILPTADPETPAFTWPEPETAPWGEVLIWVDRDMKPIRIKVRRVAGGSWRRPLGPEERARVCGALAEQAWRRAGANAVRIMAGGAGRDPNDELRARIAVGQLGAAA